MDPSSGSRSSSSSSSGPALDLPAAILMGVGIGGALQGYAIAGAVVAGSGAARTLCRFVVQRCDAGDAEGLLRWAPRAWRRQGVELFQRCQREIAAARRLRKYDPQDVDFSWIDHGGHKAMDPRNDYTPEQLFQDAMASVAAHPRVCEALGAEVRPLAEPDKVVYRVHEGVTEVFLAWRVAGKEGEGEVQVKATASLLDFIYVFPEPRGRYEAKPEGFVIRPNGDWSLDCSKAPRYMKQPFGAHNGRLFHNREGVFEFDYQVRDFKHGWEGGRPWRKGSWNSKQ